jgi:hypothetical protein
MSELAPSTSLVGRARAGVLRRAGSLARPLLDQTLRLRAPSGRPIFVTGNGRSGTSWIGKTLAQAPGLVYYREPCNLSLTRDDDDTVWARYVVPGGRDALFESLLEAAFRGRIQRHDPAPFQSAARRWRAPFRVLVKEVATFPSVEWVAQRWNPEVVLVVRHPCGCALSVETAEMGRTERARLQHLLAHDERQQNHLEPFRAHLASVRTPLEVSAAIWSIKTLIVAKAYARHPEWRLVRYEELCDDPLGGFRGLFRSLALDWTSEVEAWTNKTTREASAGAFSTSRVTALQRDAWRQAMTARQIAEVRRIVEPFGFPDLATEADW